MLEIVAYIYFVIGVLTAVLLVVKFLSVLSRLSSRYSKPRKMLGHSYTRPREPCFHVVIPAWSEGDVISSTIRRIGVAKASANTPVKIWVATYPNDYSTLSALRDSLRCGDPVNIVINPLNGPTTKSQNLAHALSVIAESSREDLSRGDCYFLVLDAEVYPQERYFEVLRNTLDYDPRVVYQTKVIAYPFTSKNIKEKIVGHMYFVAQSYLQWIIDAPRRSLGKNIFLKGAGMIFPQDSIVNVVKALETNRRGFLSRYLRLADDLLISIELSRLGYRITYIDSTYTLEEPPKRLRVVIKRYVRWFKANVAVLWCYNRFILRYFFHNFVAKLSVALSPVVYVGLVTSLVSYHGLPFFVVAFNSAMALYYLFIPPIVATLDETRVPEILQTLRLEKKALIKEFCVNLISNLLSHLISPLVAIIGYYDLVRGDTRWYKTERT